MAKSWRLVVGLGNPTPQYHGTRHNVGFAVVDRLAGQKEFRQDGRAESWVAKVRLRGYPAVLAKPQTYVNRSGQAVRALARRYALDPRQIIVVLDDLALPPGTVRVRAGGGAGGHNGLQDIIDTLGTSAIPRVRIGIAGEFARGKQSDFVLERFSDEEQPIMKDALTRAAEAVQSVVTDGVTVAMNRHNRRRAAPRADKAESQVD